MNINGLGNLYDRTNTTYRTSKYAQSFSDFMDKINEDNNNVSDMSVNESTEEKSGDKKEMPEEAETRTEIVVKPDGSKVLMITVTVGGQEAVTSVELAKPTRGDIDSGISAQEAYERLGGSGKELSEAWQDEECKDRSAEVSDAEQLPLAKDETLKVTDIEVVSLNNGVSFYYNCDTGELQCINHNDSRSGRHALWSKTISPEDWERCDRMFDRYADMAAGHFVYRYQAYLRHEEFWDMYLEGQIDLRALTQKDDSLSEEELYDKFLRDMTIHKE